MNIAVAPHMPIIANISNGSIEFDNLSLLDLPVGVTLYVPEKWDMMLYKCPRIVEDHDLLSRLLELPVKEIMPTKKANFIKLTPDLLVDHNNSDRDIIKQQLYALFLQRNAKKIYAGIASPIEEFTVSSDKSHAEILNFDPTTHLSLKDKIETFVPKLTQLKHDKNERKVGDKKVSPFSAYDKNDEDYARQLLRRAYEEHPGDIDDKTYLYTYDTKYKTFVEFRPNRNNEYHGMDISKEAARKKCPHITKLYHK